MFHVVIMSGLNFIYTRVGYAIFQVVSACYGNTLHPSYEEAIVDFKVAFLDLDIKVTPKIHAVFYHVPEFCRLTGRGLGPWSEQASEAAHHDFLATWSRFKVRSLEHPEFQNRLFRAVSAYNIYHV